LINWLKIDGKKSCPGVEKSFLGATVF